MAARFPSFVSVAPLLAVMAVAVLAQRPPGPETLSPTGADAAEPGLGAPPVAASRETKESAEQLMERAVAALSQHRSFSARLRHQVHLFDQTLVGKGSYHQLGKSLRVEMTIKASGQGATSQRAHVCDGRYLWMFEDIAGRTRLSRVDLRRVRQAIESAEKEGIRPKRPLDMMIASGGFGRLLGDLEQQFEMYAVRADQLNNEPVWVLDGRWRRKRLAELLPKQADEIRAGNAARLDELPRHLPHEVRITLSRDALLLPYRIEFARIRRDLDSNTSERTAIVAMEIYEIKLNEALDPQLFDYKPGSVEIIDRTDKYLRQRGLLKKEKGGKQ